jgi:mediator of RNA polymerase II transcription subunit 25
MGLISESNWVLKFHYDVLWEVDGAMAGCLLQQCGWTSSMDVFFKWLGSISFLGGGYGDAAVAEALAEVLMVLSFFSQE